MATSTLTPTDSTAVDIKTTNETYRVYVKLDADGKKVIETQIGTAGKDNSFWNKMDAPELKDANGVVIGPNPWIRGLEQTLRIPLPGTKAGCSLIIEDEEEFVNIFTRGLRQKFQQKNQYYLGELTEDGSQLKFEPTEGAFDVTDWLREETKRRNLSPEEKAKRSLSDALKARYPNLSDDEFAAKLDQMLALFA